MMSWMSGKPGTNAIVPGSYHLLQPFPGTHARRRAVRANDTLPDDFPDYLVFVTQHSLLAFTTSLTDVSSDAHSFFVKLNFALSMDRMMRTFLPWGMAGSGSTSTPLSMVQSWFPGAKPVPKQSQYFVARKAPQSVQSLPAPQPYANAANASQGAATAYGAMLDFSAACFSAAPAAMDAWRVSATSLSAAKH